MFSTNEFTYKDRTFSADISDLTGERFDELFIQVFDDACDIGFKLTSGRTGKQVILTLHKIHKNSEGDITYWEFIPYQTLLFDNLIVWND